MDLYEAWLEKNSLTHEPHQIKGVEWCLKREMAESNKGGIIADEMGLGKTIEILGTIYCNKLAHTLIVLPYSLLAQWEKIIIKLLGIQPLIYHGVKRRTLTVDNIMSHPIVITTYGLLLSTRRSNTELRTNPMYLIRWGRIVYDEAHHLRNFGTRVNYGASQMRADITWLMTGTPIQNSEEDVYSLYRLLGFKNIQATIETLVRENMLRRTKEQAGIILPPCNTTIIPVEWNHTKEQVLATQIHRLLRFSQLEAVPVEENVVASKAHKPETTTTIFATKEPHFKVLNKAKQVCVLPKLMKKKLYKLILDGEIQQPQVKVMEMLLHTSKIEKVVAAILNRKDNGRPKLVFCYFHGEIDEFERLLKNHNMNVKKFDGRTSKSERARILNNPCDVLIGQIDATNEGLNLQAYKEIYIVSPQWNPAVEDQAIARCHRIGQTDTVEVFHFVMHGFPDADKELVPQTINDSATATANDLEETHDKPVPKYLTLDEHICNIQTHKRSIVKKILLLDE